MKLQESIKRTEAWNAGRQARQEGKPLEANPYKWATGESAKGDRALWDTGWLAAARADGGDA